MEKYMNKILKENGYVDTDALLFGLRKAVKYIDEAYDIVQSINSSYYSI